MDTFFFFFFFLYICECRQIQFSIKYALNHICHILFSRNWYVLVKVLYWTKYDCTVVLSERLLFSFFSLCLCSVSLYILNTPISRVFEYVWFFFLLLQLWGFIYLVIFFIEDHSDNWYLHRILTSFCTIKKWICFLGLEFSSMTCSSCLERVLCAPWSVKCMYITYFLRTSILSVLSVCLSVCLSLSLGYCLKSQSLSNKVLSSLSLSVDPKSPAVIFCLLVLFFLLLFLFFPFFSFLFSFFFLIENLCFSEKPYLRLKNTHFMLDFLHFIYICKPLKWPCCVSDVFCKRSQNIFCHVFIIRSFWNRLKDKRMPCFHTLR